MARKLASDKVLFITLVVLSLFGCVMIYSASAVSAGETSGNPYRYLLKQIAALALGGIAAFVVYRTDYRKFSRPWIVYGAYGLSLALTVFALFRPPINGARRWIPLGVTMLQPAELLKVALVLLLAHQLARKSEKAGDPERALLPAVVFSGVAAAVVILQPDLGTAACYVMLCAVLLWLAGARARWFLFGALGMVPVLAGLLLTADYRRARILAFLHPEADPLGARVPGDPVADRGRSGRMVRERARRRPAEALLPAVPAHRLHFRDRRRGARVRRRARRRRRVRDRRVARAAGGAAGPRRVRRVPRRRRDGDDRRPGRDQPLASCSCLVPTKGIPLPFVSYGGSSLVASWIAAGLILNISQHEVRET